MTYASLDDLIARAGEPEIRQVADRNRDNVIDTEVITSALEHADNTVNGYVGARYNLNFTVVPDLLRTWSISIARHFLHRTGAPEYVVADYKDAIAALKDVAAGRLILPVPESAGAQPQQASGSVLAAHPDQVFSPAKLRGW